VLRTLRQVERRPEPEILQDLMTTSSDLIRVRAPSREAESGSLPLEQAVAFVERARNLVLAAACAAITKRAYFATRKPTKATEYLSKVRMGQTERASYVLTILSPVAPGVGPQGALSGDLNPSEPYERQVTRTWQRGWRQWNGPPATRLRPAGWAGSSRRSGRACRRICATRWLGFRR